MTPKQALDIAHEYGVWPADKPLPEGAVLITYDRAVTTFLKHRFIVRNGELVKPEEGSPNA